MNKITKMFLIVIGACSVVVDIMTPLAIVLFLSFYLGLNEAFSILFVVIGGLASLFKAIKIGWWEDD